MLPPAQKRPHNSNDNVALTHHLVAAYSARLRRLFRFELRRRLRVDRFTWIPCI